MRTTAGKAPADKKKAASKKRPLDGEGGDGTSEGATREEGNGGAAEGVSVWAGPGDDTAQRPKHDKKPSKRDAGSKRVRTDAADDAAGAHEDATDGAAAVVEAPLDPYATTVFVLNLAFAVTPDDLHKFFSEVCAAVTAQWGVDMGS